MSDSVYSEILELLKENSTQKETRVICTCMLNLLNEINFIKKLMWAMFTTNIGLFSSAIWITLYK